MKVLIETTGEFMLVDPHVRFEIPADRPSVAQPTPFIHDRAARGQIRILATDLPANTTDEDFLGFWMESDGEQELAVASYLSQFEVEEKPAPKRGRGRKKAEE